MYYFGNKILISAFANDISVNCILSGIKPNISINFIEINERIDKIDKNIKYTIESGIKNNITTGFPIHIKMLLSEKNYLNEGIIRPYLPELNILELYNGNYSSNYLSPKFIYPIAIGGLICEHILKTIYNIKIYSHIFCIQNTFDKEFDVQMNEYDKYAVFKKDSFPVIDPRAKILFLQNIKKAKKANDTLGGTIETIIYNLPKNLGSSIFYSFESTISQILFSIPNLKGIIFGNYHDLNQKFGSQYNDAIKYENNKIIFQSNNNNGINTGFTTGLPIAFKTVFKPNYSGKNKIETVNILNGENILLSNKQQNTPIIFHQFIPIIESLVSIVVLNFLHEKDSI